MSKPICDDCGEYLSDCKCSPFCHECDAPYTLDTGAEQTMCHPCAQKLVPQLRAALAIANERADKAEAAAVRTKQRAIKELQAEHLERTPEGTQVCYLDSHGFVIVLGTPDKCEDENDPRYHNCDAMGCGWEHVIKRLQVVQPEAARDAALEQVAALTKERDEAREDAAMHETEVLDISKILGERFLPRLGGTKEGIREAASRVMTELATVREREARLEGALERARLRIGVCTSPDGKQPYVWVTQHNTQIDAALAPASPVLDHATKEKP